METAQSSGAPVNHREYREVPCGSQSSSRQYQDKAAGLVKLSSCLLTGWEDKIIEGSEDAWRLWCVVLGAAEGCNSTC